MTNDYLRSTQLRVRLLAALALAILLCAGLSAAESLPIKLSEGKAEILMRGRDARGSVEMQVYLPPGTKMRLANHPSQFSIVLEVKLASNGKPRTIFIENDAALRSVSVTPGKASIRFQFELWSSVIPRYTWYRTKAGLTMVLPPADGAGRRVISEEPTQEPILELTPEPAPTAKRGKKKTPAPEEEAEELPELEPPATAGSEPESEERSALETDQAFAEEAQDDERFSAVDFWKKHSDLRDLDPPPPDPQALEAEEASADAARKGATKVTGVSFAGMGSGKVGILKIGCDGRPHFVMEKLGPRMYRILVSGVQLSDSSVGELRKAPKSFKGLRATRAANRRGGVDVRVELSTEVKLTASTVGNEIWIGVKKR